MNRAGRRTTRPTPRVGRALLVALVLVLPAVATVLLPPEPPAVGAAPISAGAAPRVDPRYYGVGPMADVLYWADQKKACGLTRDALAAMVMVPTYTETGAGTTYTPSPMTLSRYDNQAGLYAFKDLNTAFRKAFFHPGIGMWQFDSAGGWNLSAATAINTYTAAQTAATLMAQRWCTNPNRGYAWAPWYYCGTTAICENLYNEIYDGAALRNITIDNAVSSYGGMVARSCAVHALGNVGCFFVDPAKAQGLSSWTAPNFGPAPLSAPFYVFEAGGNEYRYWLPVDTGYANTIVAFKPITANARTALTWAYGDDFCDLTTFRGACDNGPFGRLDVVSGGPGTAVVAGWAIDPDSTAPISVHVYVDGVNVAQPTAGGSRPDVGALYPAWGPNHGYSTTVSNLSVGTHTVCTYGINVGPGGNMTLGCLNVTIKAGSPLGVLELVAAGAGQVRVAGWAIDPETGGPLQVHLYVDGVGFIGIADQPRADVGAAFPAYGSQHGFDFAATGIGGGGHQVCAYAINVGVGSNLMLGCTSVTMASGSPIGTFDAATTGFGTISVRGWAIDPDSTAPIPVHLYVDGQYRGIATADQSRPDVAAAFPVYGAAHGYSFAATPFGGGAHNVCLYGINNGPGTNALLACQTVTGQGDPAGSLDNAVPSPGQVAVTGWAIDPDTTGAIAVHLYVDGVFLGSAPADVVRGDIGAAFPGYGAAHGYQFQLGPVGGGAHAVCTYGINTAAGTNRLLGCRTIQSSGDPIGALDAASSTGTSVTVSGWVLDPDTVGVPQVHVYVDGVGVLIIGSAVPRADIAAAFSGYGSDHGYSGTASGLAPGPHTVCTYGINAAGPGGNTTLGCATV
jgi:hypothetical protein